MSKLDCMLGIPHSFSSSLDHITAEKFFVKVIPPDDPRGGEEDFVTARKVESERLNARKIWKVVKKDEVPKDGLTLGGRFFMTLKNVGTPHEKSKVRFVAQRYKGNDKPYVFHDASTLHTSLIRLVLSVAAILHLSLF